MSSVLRIACLGDANRHTLATFSCTHSIQVFSMFVIVRVLRANGERSSAVDVLPSHHLINSNAQSLE